MVTIHKNKQLDIKGSAIGFLFTYSQRDVEKMLALSHQEGSVWFKPLGDGGRGTIGGLGKGLWSSLIDCFPDLDNMVNSAVLESDGSVRCLVDISGTQAKDFAGIPSKGKRFVSEHVFIFRHGADGLIEWIEIEWDHEGFQRQLGVV